MIVPNPPRPTRRRRLLNRRSAKVQPPSTAAVSVSIHDAAKVAGLQASQWLLVRRLLGIGWKYRLGASLVVLQQVLMVALTIAGLQWTGLAIDMLRYWSSPGSLPPAWPVGLSPSPTWSRMSILFLLGSIVLTLGLLNALLRFWTTLSASRLVERIVVDLRTLVYDKLQRLSFRFFDANDSGSLINRVAGDVQAVRLFVDGVIVQVLAVSLSLIVNVTYMSRIHAWLTLACLASTPLLWWGAVIFSKKVRPEYIESSRLGDVLIRVLSENIQGQHVVKSFNLEDEQRAKFAEISGEVRRQKQKIFRTVSLFQPAIGFLTQLNMVVLLFYGGRLVVAGELRLGEGLFVFANLLSQFAAQVAQITAIANSIQHSLTGAARVFEVLDAPEEVADPLEPRPWPGSMAIAAVTKATTSVRRSRSMRVSGAVRFDSVGFGYKREHPLLHDIDFNVPAGSIVGITGPTGAGKTTLVNLIPRFYDVTSGRVTIDGVDVRDVPITDLRRQIGIVFQESFLFSNTIAANISFGWPDAPRERIEEAAKLAAAAEFIERLPDQYDTIIGEHGNNLSGGQRQRLALARAILLSPAILILDDATASVDPETEGEILAAMSGAIMGRTTFLVTQRVSTLRRADLVLVLDGGRLVQQGTHAELLDKPGLYRTFADLQGVALNKATASGFEGFNK